MRRSADRLLGWTALVVVLIGLGVDIAVGGPDRDPNRIVLLVTLTLLFVTLISRLVLALWTRTRRRAPLVYLLVGITLWAVESALVATPARGALPTHAAPGEILFLLAYLALIAYLITDTERQPGYLITAWLDAAVVSGGVLLLAGTLLLTPIAAGYGIGSWPMLVALIYPVADLLLACLVLAQIVLQLRQRGPGLALAIGFLALAVADALFVDNVTTGSHGSTRLLDLLWATGFGLIVAAASRTRPDAPLMQGRTIPSALLLGAALVAIGVLVARPVGGLAPYLTSAAAGTLIAAGGRLVIALRQARGAADAFQLARTDDLTLLPNRRAALARIDAVLATDAPMGLMLMDLDGFKDINDTLGHGVGDDVLRLCARRMRDALPDDAMLARLGGDEFAVVLDRDDEIELLELAQLVLAALRQPSYVDGLQLVVNASLGITVRQPLDRRSSALLRRADVAMYQAKNSGGGALLYDASRDEFSRSKLELAEELRHGIPAGQLVLWYQPQINAGSGEICGLEALVRWQHPIHGLLSPVTFLPAARHAGLMLALSEAVINGVVDDMISWQADGLRLRVALNCAPPELLSGAFLPSVVQAVARTGIDPSDLMIEVTEDSFLADPERTRSVLQDLRHTGLQIAIDDYGTGFSSLTYLRDLPVDELKIDRSFVSTMPRDDRSRRIVESTLQMAHALDLRFVAEGVEDEATTDALIAMGVDVLQGYHLGRPMPPGQVRRWIAEHGRSAAPAPADVRQLGRQRRVELNGA